MTNIIIAIEGIVILYLWWRISGLSKAIIIFSQTFQNLGKFIDDLLLRVQDLESNQPVEDSDDDEEEESISE